LCVDALLHGRCLRCVFPSLAHWFSCSFATAAWDKDGNKHHYLGVRIVYGADFLDKSRGRKRGGGGSKKKKKKTGGTAPGFSLFVTRFLCRASRLLPLSLTRPHGRLALMH
jgi:hypothetical protein